MNSEILVFEESDDLGFLAKGGLKRGIPVSRTSPESLARADGNPCLDLGKSARYHGSFVLVLCEFFIPTNWSSTIGIVDPTIRNQSVIRIKRGRSNAEAEGQTLPGRDTEEMLAAHRAPRNRN